MAGRSTQGRDVCVGGGSRAVAERNDYHGLCHEVARRGECSGKPWERLWGGGRRLFEDVACGKRTAASASRQADCKVSVKPIDRVDLLRGCFSLLDRGMKSCWAFTNSPSRSVSCENVSKGFLRRLSAIERFFQYNADRQLVSPWTELWFSAVFCWGLKSGSAC